MLKNDGAYDFPSTLKNQDPVLVSVLTARGGGMSLEDELEEEQQPKARKLLIQVMRKLLKKILQIILKKKSE